MKELLWIVPMAALLLTGCAPAQHEAESARTQKVTTSAIREAADARFAALARGDVEGYLAPYADDAIWMPPGSVEVTGKAAARQRMQGLVDEMAIEMKAETEEEEVLSPEWVLERGAYSLVRTPKKGGQVMQTSGGFLTIWHLQPDGNWKIAYDVWNVRTSDGEPAK